MAFPTTLTRRNVPEATGSHEPPPTNPRGRTRRVTGLDVARAFALLGMFIVHFGGGPVGASTGWQSSVTRFFDGRAMPLFVVLSGCGVAFLLERSQRPWREMAGRAALLLLVGLAFEAAVPVAVILQAYALYFLFAVPARKIATRWLLPTAAVVMALGAASVMFLVRHLPNALEYAQADTSTFGSLYLLGKPHVLASNLLFTGVYPVFPSFAFVLVGMWLARHDLTSMRRNIGLVVAGAAIAVVGYGSGFATNGQRVDRTTSPVNALLADAATLGVDPKEYLTAQATANGVTYEVALADLAGQLDVDADSLAAKIERGVPARDPSGWTLLNQAGHSNMPAWMIGASGWSVFVIGVCLVIAERARKLLRPFVALGQVSLTAYVAHLALFRWPMKNWPWGFKPTEGLLLILGGWVLAAVVAWAWKSRFAHGPLEYVLRQSGRLASATA
jgi:uncharacterized membrane protein YeiB